MDVVQLPMHPSVPDTCCVGVFDGHGGSAISTAVYDTSLGFLTFWTSSLY